MSAIPKFVGEYPFGVINPEYVEQLEQFFRKYAVGDLTVPSCLGCGQPTQEFKIGHLELRGIGLCERCTDAIRSTSDAACDCAGPVGPAGEHEPLCRSYDPNV